MKNKFKIMYIKGMDILESYYGHTINDKGYKVLNHVRMIQGDGINHESIENILEILEILDRKGYSADNIVFGQGGTLLQVVDRDTCKFAMKCSAIKIAGKWRDVYKDPITDKGKRSKKGRFSVVNNNGNFETVGYGRVNDCLKERFYNGKIVNTTTFDEVRGRQ